MLATNNEIQNEIILRLKLLNVPEEVLKKATDGLIPVTTFNAEVKFELDEVHKKVLKLFEERNYRGLVPFYITESWHFSDMISILYVDPEKETWKWNREDAKRGIHNILAYNIDYDQCEFGSGIFSIEDGVLWRAG